MDGRQIPTRSAAVAIAFWLLLVLAAMAWWRPRFWDEPHERFERAQALAGEGKKAEALDVVKDAVASGPANTGFLVFQGYRELELKKVSDAERTFRQALAQEPSNVDASLGLATALAGRNARAAALRTAQSQQAAALTPAQLRQRSHLYAELGAHPLALDDLAQLLHQRPNDPDLLRDAALHARAMKDWQLAATLTLRLSLSTSDPKLREWANETRGEALAAA